MASYIASYDLKETNPDPHSTFLKKAVEKGWQLWILSDNGFWYRLPNTTLVGTFQTQQTAVAALEATRAATELEMGRTVTMEKWIVAQYDVANFASDVTQKK